MVRCLLISVALTCLAGLGGCAAAETSFVVQGQPRDTFNVRPEIDAAAKGEAAQLVRIAQDRFGIALDYSEDSIVQLQRVAEALRGEMQPWRNNYSTWSAERQQWTPLLGAYFGEVLVRHRNGMWGSTTFLFGSDRAIGYAATHSVTLPVSQMDNALGNEDSVCNWYVIDLGFDRLGRVPADIEACSKKPWQKSAGELAHEQQHTERMAAARARDMEARQHGRTWREIEEVFNARYAAMVAIFQKHHVTKSGRVLVTFTITPAGDVTEARLLSSDYSDVDLGSDLLGFVRALRFEARNVPAYVCQGVPIGYSIE